MQILYGSVFGLLEILNTVTLDTLHLFQVCPEFRLFQPVLSLKD